MNRLRLCWRSLSVATFVLFAALGWADRIVRNNGQTLNGAITQQTATEYAIKTEIGVVRVPRADVRELLSTETTAEEVDGDVALARRDYVTASKNYQAALQRAVSGGQAETRLRARLMQIAQLQQQSQANSAGTQFAQAQAFAAAGQFENAQRVLESLLTTMTPTDPSTSAARMLLADIHFKRAMVARDSVSEVEMQRQLEAAIEAYPAYSKAHLMLGELYLRSSVTEEKGIDLILKGLQYGEEQLTEEESVRYHYLIAKRYYQRGDYDKASANYAQALSARGKYPQYSDALDRLVESYIKMSEKNVGTDIQKTIDNLNEALKLNPDNKDALFLLGRIYKDTGKTENAISMLTKCLSMDAAYPKAEHYLARANMDAKDYDNAIKHIELELKNDPYNYDAWADRAEVYIILAEYDKAKQSLDAAQQLEPNRWRAFLLAAQLAYRQEQYDAARDNLLKVLSIKPDAIEAHIQMGKVLEAQKQPDAAKQWFLNVVQHLERSGQLSFHYRQLMAEGQTELGAIDLSQESPRQAETRLQKALEMVPNFGNALNRLGDVKRRLGADATDQQTKVGFFKQAEQYYKQAIAADSRRADFYLSLGILYHNNLKLPTQALRNYEKYLDLGGKDPEVNKWIVEVGGAPRDGTTTGAVAGIEGTTSAVPGMTTALSANTTVTIAGAAVLETTASTSMTTQTAAAAGITTAP
ncbi:MAG: tetratricopeptide repeat protein [Candidatus Sumerlaeaceae bacterium]